MIIQQPHPLRVYDILSDNPAMFIWKHLIKHFVENMLKYTCNLKKKEEKNIGFKKLYIKTKN